MIRAQGILTLSLALLCCALFGCGSTSKASRASGMNTAVAQVCVKSSDTENRIVTATSTVAATEFCVAMGPASACYHVDLKAKTFRELPNPPPQTQLATLEPSPATVSVGANGIEVCGAVAPCKVLKFKLNKNAPPTSLAVNSSATLVAVAIAKGPVEIWDVVANKRASEIKYSRGDYRCGTPEFLGDVVAISADACGAPSARGFLYSKTGKRIAEIGGADFGTFGFAHTQIDSTLWAFLEEGAAQVVVQDVVSGKISKTVDLSELWKSSATGAKPNQNAAQAIGQPGESELLRGGPGQLVVIGGGPHPGSVAVVDLDHSNANVIHASTCVTSPSK
jgi:hypothetical protein